MMTRFPVECNSDLGNRVTPYRVAIRSNISFSYSTGSKTMTLFPVEYNCNLFNRVITYLKIGPCTTRGLVLPAGFRRMVRSNISYRYSTGSQSDDAFPGWIQYRRPTYLFNRVITYSARCLVLPGPGRIFHIHCRCTAIYSYATGTRFPAELISTVNGSCQCVFERVRLTECLLYATG